MSEHEISYTYTMKVWFITWCLCLGTIASHSSITWTLDGQFKNGKLLTSIKQTLPDGWHSYWKNPGDSGKGATIKILSNNVLSDNLEFPKPTIIIADNLITYGYKSSVIYKLPIRLTKKITQISATFEWLECSDVCIPKDKTIKLTVPKKIPMIQPRSKAALPEKITIKGQYVYFHLNPSVKTAEFYPYKNKQFDLKKTRFKNNELKIKLLTPNIATIEGELFIDDHPPLAINSNPIKITNPLLRHILLLLSAILGGLLLNIMPCVLPIIGIKALQLQQQPSESKSKDAFAYFLGILLSLYSLYAVLLIIKLSGRTIGWGFQLQSPITIQLLILLFITIMAMNCGLIQIKLPSFAAKSSNNMILNGILTTIIATPCTAPFLGSALSIALFKAPWFGILIFLCIAIGLALPVMALILNPKVSQFIPKSGAWNERIKFGLNFGFVATIGWLMWVLSSQIDRPLPFFSAVIAFFVFLLYRSKVSILKPLIIIISTTIIGSLSIFTSPTPDPNWQSYTPNLIAALENNNTPYLIDVTAKWCVTCQTNKQTVLNKKNIRIFLKEKNITLITADWTNKNATIAKLLKKFNQISIPTYIYYNGESHHVFGDILTETKLKENLK